MAFYKQLGFTDHPFAKTNADEERDLADYFVPPPFFDGVLGDPALPSSSIVLAPRGGGKTALRRMLEENSEPNNYLAVSYDRFEFSAGQTINDITLQYHLRRIIARVLVAYLSNLSDSPDLLTRLPSEDRRRVSSFVHSYLGDVTGDGLQEILKELKGLPERFREFWRDKVGFLESLVNLLLKNYGLEKVDLPETSQEEKSLADTYKHQLEYIGKLVRDIGLNSVYVLIDKPDETELTGNDAPATYRLVQPMIRDLELLGLEGFGFKFFLWDQVDAWFREDARPDRIHQYHLNWTRAGLQRVLSERLKSFSEGKITSFAQLCSSNCKLDVDAAVCIIARGSPRNVIRICERILIAQSELNPDFEGIEVNAIDQGIMAYCEEIASEQYSQDILRDLQRCGRELFTVNYLANEVFKVHTNSARNKITGWISSGVVKQLGTISVEGSNRPLNFYYVADPVVVRLIHRQTNIQTFLEDRWIPCDYCRVDNLADIELFPEGNDPVCIGCGRELL